MQQQYGDYINVGDSRYLQKAYWMFSYADPHINYIAVLWITLVNLHRRSERVRKDQNLLPVYRKVEFLWRGTILPV